MITCGHCTMCHMFKREREVVRRSNVTRDVEYKPFVSSSADVTVVDLDGTEDFVLLACDGLWDVLQPQDAIDVVYSYLAHYPGDVNGVAARLVQVAKERGSSDNITIIVTFLRDVMEFPKDTGVTGIYKSDISSELQTDDQLESKAVNGDSFEVSVNSDVGIIPESFANASSAKENETNELLVFEQRQKEEADLYDIRDSHDFVDFGTRTLRRNQIKPGAIQEFNKDYEDNLFSSSNPFGNTCMGENYDLVDVAHASQVVSTNPFNVQQVDLAGESLQSDEIAHQYEEISSGYSAEVPLELSTDLATHLVSTLSPNAAPFVMPHLPTPVNQSPFEIDQIDNFLHSELPTAPDIESMTPFDEKEDTFATHQILSEGIMQQQQNEIENIAMEHGSQDNELLIDNSNAMPEIPINQYVEETTEYCVSGGTQVSYELADMETPFSNKALVSTDLLECTEDSKSEMLLKNEIMDPTPLLNTGVFELDASAISDEITKSACSSPIDNSEFPENICTNVSSAASVEIPLVTESVSSTANDENIIAVMDDQVSGNLLAELESPIENQPQIDHSSIVVLPGNAPDLGNVQVSDDVEDDESEDGEEWKFYRIGTKNGHVEKAGSTSPMTPEKVCATTPLNTTAIFTKDLDISMVTPIEIVEPPMLPPAEQITTDAMAAPPSLFNPSVKETKSASTTNERKPAKTTAITASKVVSAKTEGSGTVKRSSATAAKSLNATKLKVDQPATKKPVASTAKRISSATLATVSTKLSLTKKQTTEPAKKQTTEPAKKQSTESAKKQTTEPARKQTTETAKKPSLVAPAATSQRSSVTSTTRSLTSTSTTKSSTLVVTKKAISSTSTASARVTPVSSAAKRHVVPSTTKPVGQPAIANKSPATTLKSSTVASKKSDAVPSNGLNKGLPKASTIRNVTTQKPSTSATGISRQKATITKNVADKPTTTQMDIKETKEKVNKQILGTMKKSAPAVKAVQTTSLPKSNEKAPKNIQAKPVTPPKSASSLSQRTSNVHSNTTRTIMHAANKKPLTRPSTNPLSKNVPLKGSKRVDNNTNEKGILDADSKEVNISLLPKIDSDESGANIDELSVVAQKCEETITTNENPTSSNDDQHDLLSNSDALLTF